MHLKQILCAAFLACAPQVSAQIPGLRTGDTVRVWRQSLSAPVQSTVVSSTADSLTLATRAFPLRDVSRVDVARGRRFNRGKMAKFVVGGLIPGLAAGILINRANPICDTCASTINAPQVAALFGAGIGWLLARKYAMEQQWYTVWPAAPAPLVAEVSPPPDSARRTITPAHFATIKIGELVQVWTHGSPPLDGEYGGLLPDSSAMSWLNKGGSVPLPAIDALEVGHRQTGRGLVLGAAGLGVPVALLAGLACALGPCESDRVGLVIGGFTAAGGILGAAVGHSRISWQLRFSR